MDIEKEKQEEQTLEDEQIEIPIPWFTLCSEY